MFGAVGELHVKWVVVVKVVRVAGASCGEDGSLDGAPVNVALGDEVEEGRSGREMGSRAQS